MTFTITAMSRCAGLNHYHFTVSSGDKTVELTFDKDDFLLEPNELQDAFLARVRSAVKEAGASNYAQARTALINKEFKL